MSHACIGDAFLEHEALYSAQVTYATFGHLEPVPGTYRGWIVFINGVHGDQVAVDWEFDGMDACPGVFYEMSEWINEQCHEPGWIGDVIGSAATPGVYRLDGSYRRYKNGRGRFFGKVSKLFAREPTGADKPTVER